MTDTTAPMTAIDQANATIMGAETQALSDFAAKFTAFLADVQTISATLGSGGPNTGARTFFSSTQGQLGSMVMSQLQQVLAQYGLVNQNGSVTTAPPIVPAFMTGADTAS